MTHPPRILIIRPSALGDVCRSVGVLAHLRRCFPDAVIDWLVQDTFADAIRHHPALSGVVEFPRAAMASWWKSPASARRTLDFLRSLRARRYDLVLDCQGLLRSGIFALATGAPRRFGYADAAEGGSWFFNRRVDAPRTLHTVDRMMRLARAVSDAGPERGLGEEGGACEGPGQTPDLRLYTSPADRAWLEHQRTDKKLGPRYAVLAPTSRWEGKRWPAERFALIARHLLDTALLNIDTVAIVAGHGPQEAAQARPLTDLAAADPRIVSFVGATTVGRLMALIESSSLVIANDSAALHMAVGFSRPAVALYGPTDLALVGPYDTHTPPLTTILQHIVPGEPLNHKDDTRGRRYMDRIQTPEVITAINTCLGRRT